MVRAFLAVERVTPLPAAIAREAGVERIAILVSVAVSMGIARNGCRGLAAVGGGGGGLLSRFDLLQCRMGKRGSNGKYKLQIAPTPMATNT